MFQTFVGELVDEDFVTRFMQQWDLFFDLAPELMNYDVLSVCKGIADCFAAFGPSLFDRISVSIFKSLFTYMNH